MSSSHSNASTASNNTNTKVTKAALTTKASRSGHRSAVTAFTSLVSRSCQRGPKPLTIHCHMTWTGFHGYADRKFNKHDPDSLYGDIEDFLNSASLQGELPATPHSLSQCSFIQHDSEASARKEVTRHNGILKGYHWYPDTLHHQGKSLPKTRTGTSQQPSSNSVPLSGADQEDEPGHPFAILGLLRRQEMSYDLRGPGSTVQDQASVPA